MSVRPRTIELASTGTIREKEHPMNNVGDTTATMAGIDFVAADPFAIVSIPKQIWCVAPHGRILGWIRCDGPETYRRAFHVYSHGLDGSDRRVWVKAFETIGSATTFIRQHAAEMPKLSATLQPDPCELIDGKPSRRATAHNVALWGANGLIESFDAQGCARSGIFEATSLASR
jgi:hypothetical protein